MKQKKIRLICRSVRYYSQDDESAFFEWIEKIPSIAKCHGVRDELYLDIKNKKINEGDLEELIGIFYRYKIKNMSQLKIFLNDENKEWFYENRIAFWHKPIFGEPRTKLVCNDGNFKEYENKELFVRMMMRIPCVDEVDDFHPKMDVYVKNKKIPEQDLRDILSMFYHYKINMRQLKIFLNEENEKWFKKDKDTFWYKLVFGKKK